MGTMNIFKTDQQKELHGVEFTVNDNFTVRVRRAGNADFDAAIKRAAMAITRRMRHGALSMEKLEELQIETMSQHILVGWSGLQEEQLVDGKKVLVDVTYSSKKAAELLRDWPDFRKLVDELSSDIQLFRERSLSDAEGN